MRSQYFELSSDKLTIFSRAVHPKAEDMRGLASILSAGRKHELCKRVLVKLMLKNVCLFFVSLDLH